MTDGETEFRTFTQEELDHEIDRVIIGLPRRYRLVSFRRNSLVLYGVLFFSFALLAGWGAGELWASVYASGETPPSAQEFNQLTASPGASNWLLTAIRWRGEIAVGLAAFFVIFGLLKLRKSARLRRGIKRPPYFLAALLCAVVLTIGAAALWALLNEANKVAPDKRPEVRIEAIKTAATVAVGTSGVGALLLGARRFWTSETDKLDEKFKAAVDLIGSEQGSVRVSGMVALERLAQRNPDFKAGTSHVLDYLASYADPETKEKAIARSILDGRHEYIRFVRRVYDRDITD
ncbi:hypothetical protein F8279_04760 [Micromonospora sp. AMSO1212t]|uniref:hypothetical protein n=1 Tax=Micromonospora sp. AMSO1212t TaxID=2650565 RepID=UPI00124B3AEF|nr:hypothetical protein [Micromonospora sp. AMSO1212t]KAB1909013.1 hypothetical protein F8279_04760 [Micromonospora sp. AMSO1212t]